MRLSTIFLIVFLPLMAACVKTSADKSDKVDEVDMTTMSNVFYAYETDSVGEARNAILDGIADIAHHHISREWCDHQDSIIYNAIIEMYIDTVFPAQAIRQFLFREIDSNISGIISYHFDDEDSMTWPEWQPYQSHSSSEYVATWSRLMDALNEQVGCTGKEIGYMHITPILAFVCCHKVYEDDDVVTYMFENANELHGGCGCRNSADYFTFKKSTGQLMDKDDILDMSMRDVINQSLHHTCASKLSSDMTSLDFIDKANGVAILEEGVLFYYYPYEISCGADGQINVSVQFCFRRFWGDRATFAGD